VLLKHYSDHAKMNVKKPGVPHLMLREFCWFVIISTGKDVWDTTQDWAARPSHSAAQICQLDMPRRTA
jgi:hypothetical protein